MSAPTGMEWVCVALFSDDRQLRDDVDEGRERRHASELIGGGDGIAQTSGLRVHWHDPYPRPHLGRLPWIFGGGEPADTLALACRRGRLLLAGNACRENDSYEYRPCENRHPFQIHRH